MPALDGLVVAVPIYDTNITEPDLDCDGIIDSLDPDIDGDGVPNEEDVFPRDKTESVDTDGDGIGNNADLDDDNDGYSDADEIAYGSDPLDPNSTPAPVSNEGFRVSPLTGTSSQVAFTIALTHKPDSNVTLHYGSEDETVAKPTTSTMTFTPDTWYREQIVRVDIFNPNSSTEIVFDPTISDDGNYSNRRLEPVPIVSHQLLLFPPKDTIVYSEFNMSIPVTMAYVGDHEHNITVTLDTAPNGMTLDVKNGRVLWNPPLSMEGQDVTVGITVSDGQIEKTLTFDLHVAQPTLLATSIVNNKLVITDNNASLNGLSVEALDGAVLTDYRLYKLSPADTPAFSQGESVVGEALLIKGNIGKKVKVTLPLQGLVATDELLSFHTKSYFGAGNWRRVDYDYNFTGTLDQPVYELNSEAFAGVLAFTKTASAQQVHRSNNRVNRKRARALGSGVTCSPVSYYDTLIDLNNQTCTFDNKPGFVLKIYDYMETEIFPQSIEDIASLITEAQISLDTLNMPYDANSFNMIFASSPYLNSNDVGKINPKDLDYIYTFIKPIGLFKDIIRFTPRQYILLNKRISSYNFIRMAIFHEYFHHSQYMKIKDAMFDAKRRWYIEASAVWFSDYVRENDFYNYKYMEQKFTAGKKTYPQILYAGLLKNLTNENIEYLNALFLEMMEDHCTNFIDNFKYYFVDYNGSDPTGFINFTNVSYQLDCDFGSPTGAGNERRIETKLLYYQYATAIKKDTLLINNQAQTTLNFRDANPVIKANTWSEIEQNVTLNWNWQNSAAQTIHVERANGSISHCKERYIHFESQNNIMVSIASTDTDFPDTPSTMLGDMKQLNFTMNGTYDFTYFYDPNTGNPIYPEMYITLVDIVEDPSDNNSYQAVDMRYGIRRKNLLSYIDNKDVCAPMPPITQTTIEAKGDIPYQYRDNNNPTRYIDTIKITDINSGNTYVATVQSDGNWVKTITFTFNSNNEAPILIEGYNSSDTSRIITREGILVWR